jgi:hypothetical protein
VTALPCPVALGYAELLERLSPGAWLYSFTNPADLVTQALRDVGFARDRDLRLGPTVPSTPCWMTTLPPTNATATGRDGQVGDAAGTRAHSGGLDLGAGFFYPAKMEARCFRTGRSLRSAVRPAASGGVVDGLTLGAVS